jgi:hypothetical protein
MDISAIQCVLSRVSAKCAVPRELIRTARRQFSLLEIAIKAFTIEKGFLATRKDVKPVLFTTFQAVDDYTNTFYLLEGKVRRTWCTEKVFLTLEKAQKEHQELKQEHLKYVREQIENYQKELKEIGGSNA